MLGMIGPETLLIVIAIAALLMGGKKIPEMARGLGKAKAEFHKGLQEGADSETESATPAPKAETPAPKTESSAPKTES